MRCFLEIAYHGKGYSGWQVQPGAPSVQEALEYAFSQVFGVEIPVTGAGRTDAGVHARKMIAHFELDTPMISQKDLFFRLGKHLTAGIALLNLQQVNPEAHARFHAESREYRYFILEDRNPFLRDYSWELRRELDIPSMKKACQYLIGTRDFRSFSRSGSDLLSFDCEVSKAEISEENGLLVFRITANRFLRNMVRAIVGTLVEVGSGKLSPVDMDEIILGQDRRLAGMSAPARGLFLWDIRYPEWVYKI